MSLRRNSRVSRAESHCAKTCQLARRLLFAFVTILFSASFAVAQNPVPFVNQPLVPPSALPGGEAFTLTVNGTGFVNGATVEWSGLPLATTFVSGSRLTAAVPASLIAAPGTATITVANPGTSASSNFIYFPISQPRKIVAFGNAPGSPITIGVPYGYQDMPVALAAGDFNGDQKTDLLLELASAKGQDAILSFLGNGDGTFKPASASQTIVPGSGPDNLSGSGLAGTAVGDFNDDGKLDAAVANFLPSNNVNVFLGNGDGTFTPAPGSPVPVGAGPQVVVTADLNGDGKLDLAVAGVGDGTSATPKTITILLGNGDGTFVPAPGSPVSLPASAAPMAIAVGDYNGDGHIDLAVVDENSNTITVLLGNGDGSFKPAPGSPVTVSNGAGVSLLAAADFNGDGKLDLAAGNNGNASFSILLGNGDGTFRQVLTCCSTPVNSSLLNMSVGDLSGDGKSDLAMFVINAGAGYPAWYPQVVLGNGGGTFEWNDFSIEVPALMGTGMAVGDFNGDGMLDVTIGDTAYAELSVLLQSPPASGDEPDFSIAATGPSSATVKSGSKATFTFQVTSLNGLLGPVSLTCSGAPKDSTCEVMNFKDNSPQPSAFLFDTESVYFTLDANTQAYYAESPPTLPPVDRWMVIVWLAALGGLVFCGSKVWRRDAAEAQRSSLQRRMALLAALVLGLALGISCGSGSASAPYTPPPQGTPPGTYTLTVTGSSGGVTHSVNFTLTVQ